MREPKHLDHFADAAQQRDTAVFGMWIFLGTEVLFFGGLFLAYTVVRWSSPETVRIASGHLELMRGAVNTAILLTSSFILTLGVRLYEQGRARSASALLVVTAIMGVLFLTIKGTEYRSVIHDGHLPGAGFHFEQTVPALSRAPRGAVQLGTRSERQADLLRSGISGALGPGALANAHRVLPGTAELFFWLYFVMTGLHAAHLLIGVVLCSIVAVAVHRGRASPNTVHNTGLYWHFVDLVWIFLFPLLYLAGHG